jgi:DNA-binding NarL/FixJ family response regulator
MHIPSFLDEMRNARRIKPIQYCGVRNAAMKAMLVDGHPMVVATMKALVRRALRPEVLHVEQTIDAAIARARAEQGLNLVVFDLELPGCAGVAALISLRRVLPDCSIVVLSESDDPQIVRAALEAGVKGFIHKTFSLKAIEAALRLVLTGEIYVPSSALSGTARPVSLIQHLTLTARQIEVLRALVRGLPNRAIASQLKISTSTVKQHTRAIFHVLGVTSRTAAVSEGIRRGLISVER